MDGPQPPRPSRLSWAVSAALGVASGILLVSQGGINTRLRRDALGDSPIPTACISFSVGLVAVAAVAATHGRLSGVRRDWSFRTAPWYAYLSGLLGPLYVVAAVLLAERLGFAAFQLCTILGQMLVSCLLDGCGLLGLQRRRPTPLHLVALVGLATGTVLAIEGVHDGVSDDPWWQVALFALCATGAGSILPIQAMVNATMAKHLRTPFRAVAFSFFMGAVVLALISGGVLAASGPLSGVRSGEAWMYTGGLCGAFFVTSNAIGIPRIGAAGYSAIFVASQLTTAFAYDAIGAFGFDVVRPTARRVAGVLLATASAVVYQLLPRSAQQPDSPSEEVPEAVVGLAMTTETHTYMS